MPSHKAVLDFSGGVCLTKEKKEGRKVDISGEADTKPGMRRGLHGTFRDALHWEAMM